MAYKGYRGRNIGRLLAFLYDYTCSADYWQFGDGTVISGGKTIATYEWEANTDIPNFNFLDGSGYEWLNQHHQRHKDRIIEDTARFPYSSYWKEYMSKLNEIAEQKV